MPHHLSTFSSQFSPPPAARHYHPTLSIWLSVDPMADKYPGVSPYAYCGNNPVRLKDPDGRDIIDVDQKTGRTTITKQEGDDILRCGEKTKDLKGNGVYREALEAGEKEGNNGGTLLVGMSKSNARTTFNFMADNTNVEWGYLETKSEDGSLHYTVGSAHSDETESLVFSKAMEAKERIVLRYDHNHIVTTNPGLLDWAPSTPESAAKEQYVDTDAWNDLMEKNPKVTLGIRYSGETKTFIDKGSITNAYPYIRKFMK